jgi:hypothetical protein
MFGESIFKLDIEVAIVFTFVREAVFWESDGGDDRGRDLVESVSVGRLETLKEITDVVMEIELAR